jgi:hypothetical protein
MMYTHTLWRNRSCYLPTTTITEPILPSAQHYAIPCKAPIWLALYLPSSGSRSLPLTDSTATVQKEANGCGYRIP